MGPRWLKIALNHLLVWEQLCKNSLLTIFGPTSDPVTLRQHVHVHYGSWPQGRSLVFLGLYLLLLLLKPGSLEMMSS